MHQRCKQKHTHTHIHTLDVAIARCVCNCNFLCSLPVANKIFRLGFFFVFAWHSGGWMIGDRTVTTSTCIFCVACMTQWFKKRQLLASHVDWHNQIIQPSQGCLGLKKSRDGFVRDMVGFWVSWVSGVCFRMVVLERRQLHGCSLSRSVFVLVIFGDDRLPGLSHTRPNKTLQDSDDFLKRKCFYPKQVTFMRNFSFTYVPMLCL